MTTLRPQSTLVSLTIHTALIGLLLLASKSVTPSIPLEKLQTLHLSEPLILLPRANAIGGGGGAQALTPAPEGHLPKISPRQFVPPVVEILNLNPKLTMEPTIEGPPELAQLDKALPNLGDPLSRLAGTGAGTGGPLGIGNSRGTGIGNKGGPGAGDGNQPYGPVYRAGNGVTPPLLLRRVEPEFSEEARKAKYSGIVRIYAEIDQNGHPRNLRIANTLGRGLDEKAIEAVTQWLFKPGTKDGKPVTVSALIEVSFHLL